MSDAQRVEAFAPGRVNLIGEHTDYNDGLALPFAIGQGVTVVAEPVAGDEIHAVALDLGEEDRFAVGDRESSDGWRAFVRGTVAELAAEGVEVAGARLEIRADLPRGAGLSSSAALTVALGLALLGVSGVDDVADASGVNGVAGVDDAADVDGVADVSGWRRGSTSPPAEDGRWDPLRLARLCSRVENEWVGARTGLLDQIASLRGRTGHALRIDFRDLTVEPVALRLDGWTLVTVDSGSAHVHAGSGYNARRAECAAACERLGIASLRGASGDAAAELPEPLGRRVRHVLDENDRVERAVDALRTGDLAEIGHLLDASHASLRDLYDSSTPAVERTVAMLRAAGAAGARMLGGGFGGHVLGLLPPGVEPPSGARLVEPAAGARLVSTV